MDKNTVWAILLSTLVLVVFTTLQMAFMPQQPTETAVSETGEIIQSESTETEAVKVSQLPVLEVSEENLKEEFVTITTESVKVTFTNRGGDVISCCGVEQEEVWIPLVVDCGMEYSCYAIISDSYFQDRRSFIMQHRDTH